MAKNTVHTVEKDGKLYLLDSEGNIELTPKDAELIRKNNGELEHNVWAEMIVKYR